jgi:hypothetical protein
MYGSLLRNTGKEEISEDSNEDIREYQPGQK